MPLPKAAFHSIFCSLLRGSGPLQILFFAFDGAKVDSHQLQNATIVPPIQKANGSLKRTLALALNVVAENPFLVMESFIVWFRGPASIAGDPNHDLLRTVENVMIPSGRGLSQPLCISGSRVERAACCVSEIGRAHV